MYTTLSVLDEARLTLTPKTNEAHAAMLVQALVKAGVGVSAVLVNTPTLEDVFFALVRQQRRIA